MAIRAYCTLGDFAEFHTTNVGIHFISKKKKKKETFSRVSPALLLHKLYETVKYQRKGEFTSIHANRVEYILTHAHTGCLVLLITQMVSSSFCVSFQAKCPRCRICVPGDLCWLSVLRPAK
jgi:hypothetical protein